MSPVMNKLVNASIFLGISSCAGYAYGLMGNLPARQVALAWAICEVADIAIQCFANAYISKEERIGFKVVALAISDMVGLVALAQAGLMGSTLMGTALVVFTVIKRISNALGAILPPCECCFPGPRFTMDIVGYQKPERTH